MSYLGRRGAVAPLTSGDIPDGVIEGRDIAFFENASGQDLSGTYSTERMYLAGRTGSAPNDYNYKLVGNITVTGHLALGSIADEDIIITNDGTERTITTDASGGTLDGGNVLQDTHRTSVTGMTGELGTGVTLGSAVTGSPNLNLGNATFPAGHITNVFRFSDSSSGVVYNESTTFTIGQTPFSFNAISGRHYIISGTAFLSSYRTGGSNTDDRYIQVRLFYGTTSRSSGGTTLDNKLNHYAIGRELIASHAAAAYTYAAFGYTAYFTAGSTATHYVYLATQSPLDALRARLHADNESPHICVIYEVMP